LKSPAAGWPWVPAEGKSCLYRVRDPQVTVSGGREGVKGGRAQQRSTLGGITPSFRPRRGRGKGGATRKSGVGEKTIMGLTAEGK